MVSWPLTKACTLKPCSSSVPAGPQQPGRTCSTELLETGIPAKQTSWGLCLATHQNSPCKLYSPWLYMKQVHLYFSKAISISESCESYCETNKGTHFQITGLPWFTMMLSTFFLFPALKRSCNCLVFLDTSWVLWQDSLLSAFFRKSSNKYLRYLSFHTI